jgi:TonB family protein
MKTILVLSTIGALIQSPAFAQEEGAGDPSLLAVVADRPAVPQDTARPPADNVVVDREPVVKTRVEPKYPKAALDAGVEGIVWVKVWVDRAGRPRDAQILKSDAEVFNQSVIEAALGFRFEPASFHGTPVDVWVSVPFKFKLAPAAGAGETNGVKDLVHFVRAVLQGDAVDTSRVGKWVFPGATATLDGRDLPLVDALRQQIGGRHVIEQSKRTVASLNVSMGEKGEKGGGSFITAKTEGKAANAKPRYHTIVLFSNDKGEWTLRRWHSSE